MLHRNPASVTQHLPSYCHFITYPDRGFSRAMFSTLHVLLLVILLFVWLLSKMREVRKFKFLVGVAKELVGHVSTDLKFKKTVMCLTERPSM